MGRKLASLELEDGTDISEIAELVECLEGSDFLIEQKWSSGKIIVTKRMDKTLEESANEG